MTTVVKIGGSLLESGEAARLMRALAAFRPRRLVIVPGGGRFADEVRAAQKRHGFSDSTAHHMALLAMEMVGAMLSDCAPGFALAESEAGFAAAWQRHEIPIWAPTRMALAFPEIRASWDVTSDSLAAWLGEHIRATRLLLVKSCDVPADIASNARALATAGIVDPDFPAMVARHPCAWAVISGVEGALRELAGQAADDRDGMAG